MADPDCISKLKEAREALHALLKGEQVQETWTRGGVRVRYTQADIGELRSYIRELDAECGLTAVSGDVSNRRRPFGVIF